MTKIREMPTGCPLESLVDGPRHTAMARYKMVLRLLRVARVARKTRGDTTLNKILVAGTHLTVGVHLGARDQVDRQILHGRQLRSVTTALFSEHLGSSYVMMNHQIAVPEAIRQRPRMTVRQARRTHGETPRLTVGAHLGARGPVGRQVLHGRQLRTVSTAMCSGLPANSFVMMNRLTAVPEAPLRSPGTAPQLGPLVDRGLRLHSPRNTGPMGPKGDQSLTTTEASWREARTSPQQEVRVILHECRTTTKASSQETRAFPPEGPCASRYLMVGLSSVCLCEARTHFPPALQVEETSVLSGECFVPTSMSSPTKVQPRMLVIIRLLFPFVSKHCCRCRMWMDELCRILL